MNKTLILLSALILGVGCRVYAQDPQPELRPSQVVMRARAAWMKAMNENLAAKLLAEVAKSADELSAQAAKVAAGASGEPQTLHQRVADLAKEVSTAATQGDEALIRTKLSAISATCTECHTKFRPKP
jgi:cytochrome c556